LPEAELLVIAGHDPSYGEQDGVLQGAGIDADREAAEAFGVQALTVVTAWTEQAGGRVESLGPVVPAIWAREALLLLSERRQSVRAIKFGLLPSEAAVRMASDVVRRARQLIPKLWVVVDPVLAASGGEELMSRAARRALAEDLMCQGVVLTPNQPEARALLAGADPAHADEVPRLGPERLAARLFHNMAGRLEERRALVLKGGHGIEDPVCDWIVEADGQAKAHRHPRRKGASLHGSGCRHASALAANLCLGRPVSVAAKSAGEWLAERFQALP
jgi:hydroxymethylpyrimidine/phosphomethylpyrimidine kinase